MMEAAKADPIFEGVPESVQRSVLSAWGSAIAEYSNKHRCSPRPEVLAAAHQTLENCLLMENVQSGQKSLNDIMLESINAEVMSSQDGIIRQPIFPAMILPVARAHKPVTHVPSFRYRAINPRFMKSST